MPFIEFWRQLDMLYIITKGDYELTLKAFDSIKNDKNIQIIKTFEIFNYKSRLRRKISKIFHKININCYFNFSPRFKMFSKSITEKDSVLIWSSISPLLLDFSHYIKAKNKYIWLWNSLFTYSDESRSLIPELSKHYKILTFDKDDVNKYKIYFKNQFCYDQIKNAGNKKIKYDLYFVGQDKNRYDYIEKLYSYIHNDVRCNFKIIRDKYSIENHKINFYSQEVTFEENIKNIGESKAILEIVQENQSGLTVRALEALISNKKLVTNNKNIINEPFYSAQNIFILGSDDLNTITDFLNSKFDADFDYSDYMFSNWIKEFAQS